LKKLVSIAVILALLVGAIVPATVGAWNPAVNDGNLTATTPIGDLTAKIMKLTFTLLGKWITQDKTTVKVEQYIVINNTTGVWNTSKQDVGAVVIAGLTDDGAKFIADIGEIIMWGTHILADIVGMMGGR
jgi:hypothetical protein